ncbi:ribonuclease HI family protein [Candidatus Oleimmundimicrobium sp.]|uniref:ribonuclease HI family protein n=1 Tax=Candidatus Oleimmundimicrobium sp. TaxID=3060597 RepID=UPI00271ECD67|nr:ribonuclease HI family protein [Candidatus Oleimmundimicrobium sp.]MDO8885493.1 ribonuclease HI family protein [Candidatus Oleimmundimicrobium sp.]
MKENKPICQEARLILRVDGAARGNPGHAGIGGVILNESGSQLFSFSEYIGEATNNVAEYSALIFGLGEAANFKSNSVVIYSDSELLVQQLNGFYKVKNAGLKPLFEEAKKLLSSYTGVTIKHVPREENKEADELANQAIDDYLSGKKQMIKLRLTSKQESLF